MRRNSLNGKATAVVRPKRRPRLQRRCAAASACRLPRVPCSHSSSALQRPQCRPLHLSPARCRGPLAQQPPPLRSRGAHHRLVQPRVKVLRKRAMHRDARTSEPPVTWQAKRAGRPTFALPARSTHPAHLRLLDAAPRGPLLEDPAAHQLAHVVERRACIAGCGSPPRRVSPRSVALHTQTTPAQAGTASGVTPQHLAEQGLLAAQPHRCTRQARVTVSQPLARAHHNPLAAPEPTSSTPSSRSGASAAPMSTWRPGSMLLSSDTCEGPRRTGTTRALGGWATGSRCGRARGPRDGRRARREAGGRAAREQARGVP
jgi:hypothetical protein